MRHEDIYDAAPPIDLEEESPTEELPSVPQILVLSPQVSASNVQNTPAKPTLLSPQVRSRNVETPLVRQSNRIKRKPNRLRDL